MKFGVSIFVTHFSAGPAEIAAEAERLGFESLFVSEHSHIPVDTKFPLGDDVPVAYRSMLDPFVSLGAAASVTSRIKLGTAILNVYSRSPGLMAIATESLNELYPGRFILGLGASTKAVIEGFHGIPFDKPAARMREVAQIVRKATAGEEVNFKGRTVSLQGFRLRVPPRCPPPCYRCSRRPRPTLPVP